MSGRRTRSQSRGRAVVEEPVNDPVEQGWRTPAHFLALKHYEPVWVDVSFLVLMGIYERVRDMLIASGWGGLLSLTSEADVEDTSEFLGTFHYIGRECSEEEDQGFIYTHRGTNYTCSMARLREVFGWPENGEINYETENNLLNIWVRLVRRNVQFEPSQSIARHLPDPAMFYLHFILSRTIFAKKNGLDKISVTDLAILHMLSRGIVIDWAYYFCTHLGSLRKDGPVAIGGMVTYLLRTLHPSVPGDHKILRCGFADLVRFQSGRNVKRDNHKRIVWAYFAEPSLRPEITKRARGRPPGSGKKDRGGTMTVAERGESSGGGSSRAQQEEHFTQEELDFQFNMRRALVSRMRHTIVPMPAPPGWKPNDPIPDEYLP